MVQNSFPNRLKTAEVEFMRRLDLCAERRGLGLKVVDWSHEIAESGADFVLSLHEVSPKLTPVPTICAMWNPPSGIRNDPVRCENIRSFDGYMAASRATEHFIAEQNAVCAGPPKPVADFRFYPTAPSRIAQASSYDSVVYLGVHWDGQRHGDFLTSLARDDSISLYGPPEAWSHVGAAYRGSIPFDGTSVIRRLAEHGIALCLHRQPHKLDDTPSMRLFEAASAGCLIICDDIGFAKDAFGDSIFVLADDESRDERVRQILAWARANHRKAGEMARASQRIFERRFSLDVLLPKVLSFGRTVSTLHRKPMRRALFKPSRPKLDVIYFASGPRDLGILAAVAQLSDQTYRPLRLVVVHQDRGGDTRATPPTAEGPLPITSIDIADVGGSISERLNDHIAADFVAILAANHEWAPHHLALSMAALIQTPDVQAARATRVLIARDGGRVTAPNFSGDAQRPVEENRRLEGPDRATGSAACRIDPDGRARDVSDLGNFVFRSRVFKDRIQIRTVNGLSSGETSPDGAPALTVSILSAATMDYPDAAINCVASGWVTVFQRDVSVEQIPTVEFA